MPRSMTGFGRAEREHDLGHITVELKSVNNRFLKVSQRLPDGFSEQEIEIEARIRKAISRGSVYCQVKFDRRVTLAGAQLNERQIRDFFEQLGALAKELKTTAPSLAEVAQMDGAVFERAQRGEITDTLKSLLFDGVDEALSGMMEMRSLEGEVLRQDIDARVKKVSELTAGIEKAAPQIVKVYAERLQIRIDKLLKESGQQIEGADLAREVAFFADRCDVTEETTRLRHHCDQFLQLTAANGAVGRKLDFIVQEMMREANTIGSKANDASRATTVVEMKSEIERIREQVQNLE